MSKPSIPQGTRDFLPSEVNKRNFIFNTIENVFRKYGFQPIETPAMETLDTLMGKYGEEGDKLLFKILNNGDFLAKVDNKLLEEKKSSLAVKQLSKRGLRYDLTVPFARFVVMHQNEISLPFKRYQIQPVWRADSPQKGRYQEFYQCDVDVVGSNSLVYEAELVCIYNEIFEKLGINVKILINNRKILLGLAEVANIADKFVDMTVAIDKIDKIGQDGVIKEMESRGIQREACAKIMDVLNAKSLEDLKPLFESTEIGRKGIDEIQTVFEFIGSSGIKNLSFDISLARGLSYYTGCIFEVKVDTTAHPNVNMGSIGGGGRYDNLTETFGLMDVSGVGVSLGAERIYDVLEELNLFPKDIDQDSKIIFLSFDEKGLKKAFEYAQELRKNNIACEIYPDQKKMNKQLNYANNRGFKYVAIIGDNEIEKGVISIKNMQTGEQTYKNINELLEILK